MRRSKEHVVVAKGMADRGTSVRQLAGQPGVTEGTLVSPAEKRGAQGVPSFAEATARVVAQKQAGWRSRAHGRDWPSSFERYAFPGIGRVPVSEVPSADMLEILVPIWHAKAETARRLRQRIRAVLEWAVAMEFRIGNPCDRIGPVSWVPSMTSCSTCGPCHIQRWHRPSGRCGHQLRHQPSGWRSSSWC